ncbi:MAG: hypothetical protein KKG14_06215 [Alphaproteobacteria bacterium]|nr:hypothetical protein [Alphaproteobacteria bacterium]MBU2272239.1 hypothetical protein [Alphaproteobacteria bacterium]MBU2418275.1 hypothetical protein [Alphaproteobacteria bacterium]
MNWSASIRQAHRGLSILFTVIVAGIFLALGLGRQPAEWVYFLPLFPLALMMASGLYMFALPHVRKQPGDERA